MDMRKKIWDTLCSLEGIDKEKEELDKILKYPEFLCRYRSVNKSTIDALRKNRLYFSSAEYYDDPLDSFLSVNVSDLEQKYLSSITDPEHLDTICKVVCDINNQSHKTYNKIKSEDLKIFLQNTDLNLISSSYRNNLLKARNQLRKKYILFVFLSIQTMLIYG